MQGHAGKKDEHPPGPPHRSEHRHSSDPPHRSEHGHPTDPPHRSEHEHLSDPPHRSEHGHPSDPPHRSEHGHPSDPPHRSEHGHSEMQKGGHSTASRRPFLRSNRTASTHSSSIQWTFMQAPERPRGCPPGLEYLTVLDQIIVRQELEMIEVLLNIDSSIRYRICNTQGQQIWFGIEEANAACQFLCGPLRSFIILITDNLGNILMRIERDFKYCAMFNCLAFMDLCSNTLSVEAPPGTPVGYVRQVYSCIEPKFEILDAASNPTFVVTGPPCQCECFKLDFRLFSVRQPNTVIGKITKQIESIALELFTNVDSFAVTFPLGLDVKMKASILGAVFLIDYMYFEHKEPETGDF